MVWLREYVTSQKETTSRTDSYLVILSSKTYVFEDKLTKYKSVRLIISFSDPDDVGCSGGIILHKSIAKHGF